MIYKAANQLPSIIKGYHVNGPAGLGDKDINYVTDGAADPELATNWQSKPAFGDRLVVPLIIELGAPTTICGVRLLQQTYSYAKKWSVHLSNDGVNWQEWLEARLGDQPCAPPLRRT